MEKNNYTGKTKEEAIRVATEALNEKESNLFVKEIETKNGLFKSKKVEIEVITKEEIIKYIKEYLTNLLKNMGITSEIEIKNREEVVTFSMFSDNNAILIGKNGKTLESINLIVKQAVYNELGFYYNFTLDAGEYRLKQEKNIERLVKQVAKDVIATGIAAKLDPMNAYERRIVHTILAENDKIITESEGSEPERYVVIKKRED